MVATEPFTAVGRVAKTHGLKGEVSVVSYTEASLDALVGLEVWVVPPPSGLRSSRIAGVRPGPKGPIVALDSVDSIGAAAALVGREILAATDSLPAEWFEGAEAELDLVGYAVTDEKRGPLGEIIEIIETGANDVWVVHGDLGEVLIPVIDDVVREVDEAGGRVSVRLLPGLMPDEDES